MVDRIKMQQAYRIRRLVQIMHNVMQAIWVDFTSIPLIILAHKCQWCLCKEQQQTLVKWQDSRLTRPQWISPPIQAWVASIMIDCSLKNFSSTDQTQQTKLTSCIWDTTWLQHRLSKVQAQSSTLRACCKEMPIVLHKARVSNRWMRKFTRSCKCQSSRWWAKRIHKLQRNLRAQSRWIQTQRTYHKYFRQLYSSFKDSQRPLEATIRRPCSRNLWITQVKISIRSKVLFNSQIMSLKRVASNTNLIWRLHMAIWTRRLNVSYQWTFIATLEEALIISITCQTVTSWLAQTQVWMNIATRATEAISMIQPSCTQRLCKRQISATCSLILGQAWNSLQMWAWAKGHIRCYNLVAWPNNCHMEQVSKFQWTSLELQILLKMALAMESFRLNMAIIRADLQTPVDKTLTNRLRHQEATHKIRLLFSRDRPI